MVNDIHKNSFKIIAFIARIHCTPRPFIASNMCPRPYQVIIKCHIVPMRLTYSLAGSLPQPSPLQSFSIFFGDRNYDPSDIVVYTSSLKLLGRTQNLAGSSLHTSLQPQHTQQTTLNHINISYFVACSFVNIM